MEAIRNQYAKVGVENYYQTNANSYKNNTKELSRNLSRNQLKSSITGTQSLICAVETG